MTDAQFLELVKAERERQRAKWGEQDIPDGTCKPGDGQHRANMQMACDRAAAAGELTWRNVMGEEIAEAYAEYDPDYLITELVQVAAVAMAWVQSIKRRPEHAETTD